MKRGGRLRRKSKTNSRPGVDEARRREYCFRTENTLDELVRYFPERGNGKRWIPLDENGGGMEVYSSLVACDPHHIFGGILGQNHFDFDWNLVHVSRPVHEFCERFPQDGAILSVTRKIEKGEWDEAEAIKWLKFYPIGHLSGFETQFAWIVPLWAALIGGER